MRPDITNINWLVPWHPEADGRPDDRTANELYSELCPQHVLFGVKARPVGHRQDCDDVLFELLDGSGRFAVVHLTYAQHPEPDPRWPCTTIYQDLAEFMKTMEEDAADWKHMTTRCNCLRCVHTGESIDGAVCSSAALNSCDSCLSARGPEHSYRPLLH